MSEVYEEINTAATRDYNVIEKSPAIYKADQMSATYDVLGLKMKGYFLKARKLEVMPAGSEFGIDLLIHLEKCFYSKEYSLGALYGWAPESYKMVHYLDEDADAMLSEFLRKMILKDDGFNFVSRRHALRQSSTYLQKTGIKSYFPESLKILDSVVLSLLSNSNQGAAQMLKEICFKCLI